MPRPPLLRFALPGLALALLAGVAACSAPAGLPPLPSPTATFAAATADELVVLIDQRLVVVAPGGQQREVAKTTGTAVYPAEPRWSPDGTRIAYIRRQFFDGRAETDYGDDILIVPAGGGKPQEMHHHVVRGQQASGLAWAADGNALIFGLFEPTVTTASSRATCRTSCASISRRARNARCSTTRSRPRCRARVGRWCTRSRITD